MTTKFSISQLPWSTYRDTQARQAFKIEDMKFFDKDGEPTSAAASDIAAVELINTSLHGEPVNAVLTLERFNQYDAQIGDYVVMGHSGKPMIEPCQHWESCMVRVGVTPLDRLRVEFDENAERLKKLELFLGSEKFAQLPDEQRLLLRRQCNVMQEYSKIMSERAQLMGDDGNEHF